MEPFPAESSYGFEQTYSGEEFHALFESDSSVELIDGRLSRRVLSGWWASMTTTTVGTQLLLFASQRALGDVVVGNGTFRIAHEPDTVLLVDAALVRRSRLDGQDLTSFFEGPPDIAVEVCGPAEIHAELERRMDRYLDAGTETTWLVDPTRRRVQVRSQAGSARLLTGDEVLDGGSLLPGLRLPIPLLFAPQDRLRAMPVSAQTARHC